MQDRGTRNIANTIKLFCLVLMMSFGAFQGASGQALSGDSFATIKARGSGTITLAYFEVESFIYLDDQNRLTGVEPDIFDRFINYVENTQGVSITVNKVAYSEDFPLFYQQVKNGNNGVFGVGTVSILENRKREVQFSPPYINNIVVLVSNSGVPEISSYEEMPSVFSGFKAISIPSTNVAEKVEWVKTNVMPNLDVVTATSHPNALDIITGSDSKSFTFMDLTTFWPAFKAGRPVMRHAFADQSAEEFGFIMPLNSDWKPLIDEFFNLGSGFRSNPAYRAILSKHLGRDFQKMIMLTMQKQGNK